MTDLLTAAEARFALGRGASDTSKSELLSMAITAVTQLIEGQIGPVVYGTVTAEAYDGGGNVLYLKTRPVAQIIQVVEYDVTTAATLTAESNTSKPDSAYLFSAENGRLRRRSGNADARFPVGSGNVLVTYVAGRCVAGSIPAQYKLAAAETLKSGWRAFEAANTTLGEFEVPQQTFPTFAVPKVIKDRLSGDWQVGSGGFD